MAAFSICQRQIKYTRRGSGVEILTEDRPSSLVFVAQILKINLFSQNLPCNFGHREREGRVIY